MTRNLKISTLCTLAVVLSTTWVTAQVSAVEFVDQFLDNNDGSEAALALAFVDTGARIWVSSNSDTSQLRNLNVATYTAELSRVEESFLTKFQTVVSIHRQVGPFSTVFCSVHGELVDRETLDTIYTRAIQSYKLVKQALGWKILQLNIQTEHEPFSAGLWPKELSSQYPLESKNNEKIYKKDRPYNADEVDLPPLYPFEDELDSLLDLYSIQKRQIENYSPFTVYIDEDGEAILGYVGDLSGEQIESAKAFISELSPWYPAVKDKSNVKCKLIFSIQ